MSIQNVYRELVNGFLITPAFLPGASRRARAYSGCLQIQAAENLSSLNIW